jgi:hypothetical protein
MLTGTSGAQFEPASTSPGAAEGGEDVIATDRIRGRLVEIEAHRA